MKSNREGKPVSVDEAVSAIPNHGRVYVAQGSGCPTWLYKPPCKAFKAWTLGFRVFSGDH